MTQIDSTLSSFGELLKSFRKRQHLTQQQLAEVIGVHRGTLIHWEQGNFLPESKTMVLELARHLHLNDQETRHLLEASLTALMPHWLVPLPRNPFFTGREEILEELHAQLGVEQAVALTQSSALHGLGGVGKTQIALEYAYRHALEYSAVFWIAAETDEQVVTSLLHIAEALQLLEREGKDQQRVVAAVQRWLSTHGQWLLIWDNVEDLTILQRFLPGTRSGTLLITTRCQVLGTLAQGLDLLPMEQEEGLLFLLRRAKVLSPDATREQVRQFTEHVPEQYTAALELVTILGGLPLALDQAGAYLEETRCGMPAYLDLFHTRRDALLQRRGEGIQDHPASVSTSFTLAITAAAKRHPAVRDLLQVCALLLPDAIPEEIFRQGGEHLGSALATVCRDPLEWDRVAGIAASYSLLARQAEEQLLSMHRLVQAVLLDTMTEAEQEQWNKCLMAALDAVFPEVPPATEYAAWMQCERLLPHVLLCLQRTDMASESLGCASLASKAALYLFERGRYAEAEPLYLRALHIREHVLDLHHPDIARVLNSLAALYWQQGHYARAQSLYQQALHIWEHVPEPDPLAVARTLNNLALLFWSQGNYTRAEPLYQRTLHIWEQALGLDHPGVTRALNNLAILYADQGRYVEAEPLIQRAIHIWEQTHPEHPDLAFSLCNLAKLYQEQERYVEAEPLFQRALRIREQILGPGHPEVAHPLAGLAALACDQGNYAQADALYQRALSIREQHLGQHHPDTAQTLHDLAILRQKQGKWSEALSFAEHALAIRSQSLGEAHPRTVATRTLYAQLVQEQANGAKKPAEQEAELPADAHSEKPQADRATLSPPREGDASSSASDPLQEFLDTCCELHPLARCRISALWQAYEQWAATAQQGVPLARRTFAAQIKARGCRTDRTSTARIWRGIRLRDEIQ